MADSSLPDDALSPVEGAARGWRRDVLADLGGLDAVPAARRALLDAATGTMIILSSLDRYLFTLAAQDGLVNRRSRRVFAIVEQRQRVADSLARQLQALGLERRERPAMSLSEYVERTYGGEQPVVDRNAEADHVHTPDVMDGQEGPDGALR